MARSDEFCRRSTNYPPSAIEATEPETAILFFSHRPEREWQNKWFVEKDYAKNRQVAGEFYDRARAAVDESPFPVHEVSGSQQRGDRFGRRLANAFADVFAEGYDRVIAVGNDCPELGEVDWQRVERRLHDGRAVLGPTAGGEGAYLIGIPRSQFEPEAFAALPWKSGRLLAALTEQLAERAQQRPVLLDVRDDVNDHEELVRLLHTGVEHGSLTERLRAILGPDAHAVTAGWSRTETRTYAPRSRSPPPVTSTG